MSKKNIIPMRVCSLNSERRHYCLYVCNRWKSAIYLTCDKVFVQKRARCKFTDLSFFMRNFECITSA